MHFHKSGRYGSPQGDSVVVIVFNRVFERPHKNRKTKEKTEMVFFNGQCLQRADTAAAEFQRRFPHRQKFTKFANFRPSLSTNL